MNDEKLEEERERLREVDSFTVLDYIRTSVEILMNLKIEEHEQQQILLGLSPKQLSKLRDKK